MPNFNVYIWNLSGVILFCTFTKISVHEAKSGHPDEKSVKFVLFFVVSLQKYLTPQFTVCPHQVVSHVMPCYSYYYNF